MDKLIKKISKEIPKKSKAKKDLSHLMKEDHKRDSLVEKGKKMKKKGC